MPAVCWPGAMWTLPEAEPKLLTLHRPWNMWKLGQDGRESGCFSDGVESVEDQIHQGCDLALVGRVGFPAHGSREGASTEEEGFWEKLGGSLGQRHRGEPGEMESTV